MNSEHLIRMANQIGIFFESLPDRAEGLEGIATHIRKFWDPRMRQALLTAVRRWLPPWLVLGPTDSGLHACLALPPERPDRLAMERLRPHGIGAEALSPRCWQVGDRNALVVSYARSEPAEIDATVRLMGQLLDSKG